MSNSITFLGTGTSTGVPMIGCTCSVCSSSDSKDKRLRSSAYIEYEGFKILIDCGPDFRQQALSIGLNDLDAILLTHQHKDHTGGLDDVRALNYLCQGATPIYCEERVLKGLQQEYAYAFEDEPYPGSPKFDIHIIDEKPFVLSKSFVDSTGKPFVRTIEIIPVRVWHAALPILAFRIGTLCYLTDASRIEDSEFDKLKGLDIFTVNSVRRVPHRSHFSLPDALAVIKRVGAKKSFVTHLSHQMADDAKGIAGTHEVLAKEFPEGVFPAYDGLRVEF